jgi:DNA invertase Pin-like site-specific DNA recombinase
VAELVDEGVSAFKGRHSSSGELGRFVSDVEAGAYPNGIVLLTEKLDRLSREEPGRVFIWMMRVTEAGVIVSTIDGDRQYRRGQFDMAGIIEVVVKAQLAHEESQKKADRIGAAWRRKRNRLADGERLVMTRRAPAWVTVEGSPPAFVLIDERAAVVRRIFEDTVAGYGKHSIARRLNEEGVATFGRASGWHPSYIQKILASAAVLGEMQPGKKARGGMRELVGEPIHDYYPAAIDADLHARALRSMAGRSRRVGGRGRRLVNIFSGIAKCGECKERMTFRGKGKKVRANGETVSEDYLVCDSYQRGRGCANKQHFNYAAWETAILNAVLTKAMGDEHFASQLEVRKLEVEEAELHRRRDAAIRKADAALSLYLETTREEAKEAWSNLTVESDECNAALAIIRKRITAARGVVSPAEHRQRIADLFNQMEDKDEDVRFEARSRVMEAVHELIAAMQFRTGPSSVEVTTKSGVGISVEWVGGSGPNTEFFYRYDEGFFSPQV